MDVIDVRKRVVSVWCNKLGHKTKPFLLTYRMEVSCDCCYHRLRWSDAKRKWVSAE